MEPLFNQSLIGSNMMEKPLLFKHMLKLIIGKWMDRIDQIDQIDQIGQIDQIDQFCWNWYLGDI